MFVIKRKQGLVIWDYGTAQQGALYPTPWAVLRLETVWGAGAEVYVKAWASFTLVVTDEWASYTEPIEPGEHTILLAILDRD